MIHTTLETDKYGTLTLYFDRTAGQMVLIQKNGISVRHHKIPKSCYSDDEILSYIYCELKIDMRPAPVLVGSDAGRGRLTTLLACGLAGAATVAVLALAGSAAGQPTEQRGPHRGCAAEDVVAGYVAVDSFDFQAGDPICVHVDEIHPQN